jgi:eukaryotic-like serine/threonine-protein kinase
LTPATRRHKPGTLIGYTVGNYQVKALLGEGGMGSVYLAEHTVMGWKAAIKVLRRSLADDKVLVRRFLNEARVIKAVRHPNIVEIIDVGILPDGLPYLLMELLEGETVGARLHRNGRLTVEQALDIGIQTAVALQAAHDKGITHRDLKPDNLFLVRDPEHPAQEKVKVLDFGIAKHDAENRSPSAHTRSGVLLGTPAYMSPEQCRGIAEAVDHRADIYALSVILHQMLAGRAPFVGAGTGDVLIMHVSADPPPVAQDNPAVPRFVEAAILRGLAKLREHRFQSMTEFATALRGEGTRDIPPPDPTLQIPAEPGTALPLRATESMATVVTPLSWTASGSTRSTRKLSRRAMGIGLAVAVTVPLLLVVAADGIRWTVRPQPAAAPPRAEVGGLTREANLQATPAAAAPTATVPDAANAGAMPVGAPPGPTGAARPPAGKPPAARAAGPQPSRRVARTPKAPPPAGNPATPAPPARRAKPWL